MLAIAVIGVTPLAAHQLGGPRSSSQPPAAPRVKVTSPAPGAMVAPGTLTLRVTFDRPMRPGNYSFVRTSGETYPECGANVPELSADRRSFIPTLQGGGKPQLRNLVQPSALHELQGR